MRLLTAAMISVAFFATCVSARAGEPSPVWKDGYTVNIPGQSNWVADGTPSPFSTPFTPSTSFTPGSTRDPYGFADYSVGRTLGFARDYGLGNVQATLGIRTSEPLATMGFTPTFDPRRFIGAGPRVGFEGNAPLQSSWVVEWRVGASLLSGDRSLAAMPNQVLPSNYTTTGSVLGVDGLLGLSYWFDTASKLTLGYRADYLKGAAGLNLTGADNADRIDHGPMVRFSIQK